MKQALDRSMEALRRAEDEMRKAVSGHDATAERRAAEQLAEAQNLLNKALGTQAGNSASEMAQRAQEIASAQRELARRMRQMYGAEGESESRRSASGDGGEEMPQMNDPNARRGYRRYYQGMQPRREPTQEENQIAGEKEKLARQLEQLQQQMQKQADSLAGTQPDLGRKMRNALSDAEQKELALRMQKNGELLRQGYGDRNLEMEGSVTMALDDLARELRDIQQGLKAGGQGDRPGQGDREAETLARLRSLRESLERSQQNGQSGQQPGQQQGGQQPGQQGGSQQGGSQQSGSQQGGRYSPNGGGGAGLDRRGLQDAISGLTSLRGRLDPSDRAFRGYVDNTLGSLRTLNADPRLLDSAISQDAVTQLERLEVELGRRLGEQGAGGARSGAPEPSPEKYRDAVAEYFKKLSQGR
jgi:transcriptional regulator of heat shock response